MDMVTNHIFNSFLSEMAAMAAESDAVHFLKEAVQAGLDANTVVDEESLLYRAAKSGSTRAAEFLLIHGANPNLKCKEYETPLYAACCNAKTDTAKILIDFGASIC